MGIYPNSIDSFESFSFFLFMKEKEIQKKGEKKQERKNKKEETRKRWVKTTLSWCFSWIALFFL